MAPSRRSARSSSSRSGGARSPKRLKAHREDDVACSPRLPWDSAHRRNSSSSSSSHSSGPGVDGAASKGCLIRSTRGFLSSGGSPLRPANSSLEEMASLEEETYSLKVGGCNALQPVKPLPRGLRCWGWEFWWKETKKRQCSLRSLVSSQRSTSCKHRRPSTKSWAGRWPKVPWRGSFQTWWHFGTTWKALKHFVLTHS